MNWRNVISGRDTGLMAAILRGGLWMVSWGYGAAVRTRNAGYARGLLGSSEAGLPTISIGNLTAGGTGKTPLCAWIARWLRDRQVRVCFLSRGYGSVDGTPNDEALVLEQLCPDVPHLQGADRVRLAQVAREELDSQVLVLDDAFQHRRLKRDLDVVLIDATCPWGHGHLLPRGLLREPRSALRRADLILLTRADQVPDAAREQIRAEVRRAAGEIPLIETAFRPEGLVNASGQTESLDALRDTPVAAFCGLGNPEAFRRTLADCGARIVAFREFPDHHPYTREDVESLRRWATEQDIAAVLTTQKDLVKLGLDQMGRVPLWSLQIGVAFLSDSEPLGRALDEIVSLTSKRSEDKEFDDRKIT